MLFVSVGFILRCFMIIGNVVFVNVVVIMFIIMVNVMIMFSM